jgi:hypothetical protein
MPRLEKSGYKRYWELKQLAGHDRDGTRRTIEGFRDMLTGEFTAPENGWSGQPPELPSGEMIPAISDKYAQNYDKIRWNRRGKR